MIGGVRTGRGDGVTGDGVTGDGVNGGEDVDVEEKEHRPSSHTDPAGHLEHAAPTSNIAFPMKLPAGP